MTKGKLFVGSYAPYWHNGSRLSCKSWNILLAALPAAAMGIYQFGPPALGVLAFAVSTAILWELLMNTIMKRPVTIGDGNAAVIGLLFGMLLPATAPWWLVLVGTFIAVVVAKEIFGGVGCNPFNPSLVAMAILMLSWIGYLDFDEALVNYELDFNMLYPLANLHHLGPSVVGDYPLMNLFMGRQVGGIGATFGLGLVIGGVYLMLRGYARWEISLSFIAGLFLTALLFHVANPEKYAGPLFHLLTGYALIGAFFLATEDSSSPVNFIPMLLYGALAGFLTVLIRNIGAFEDGTVLAILMLNVANPLLDRIRPRALGKGNRHA